MSPLTKIALYLLAVLLSACLLSPVAYWVVQGIEARGIVTGLGGFPFHRFFSRSVQVAVIVLGVPFAWWLGIRRLSDFGLAKNPRAVADGLTGFLVALIVAVCLVAVLWSQGFIKPRGTPGIEGMVRIAGTAAVVSVIEEFLFRGVLLGLVVRACGRLPGVVLVSFLFAAVHFLRPSRATGGAVTGMSGFEQAWSVFAQMPEPVLFGYGMLTLFAAGVLLSWVTLRTSSLWLAIGIHGGWILVQQGSNLFFKSRAKPPGEFLPWYGPNLVSGAVPTGLLPFGALLALAVILALLFRYVDRRPAG